MQRVLGNPDVCVDSMEVFSAVHTGVEALLLRSTNNEALDG